jgi:peptidoglycan hydrolase-like protein with peptidoglycan-binding domain
MERSSFGQPSSTSAAWPSDASFTQPLDGGARSKSQPGTAAFAKPSKREIQQALKNAGFYQGPVDGKIGPITRDAVKEFQRTNGLKADGVVGRQTWEKLSPYLELASKTGDMIAPPETVIK